MAYPVTNVIKTNITKSENEEFTIFTKQNEVTSLARQLFIPFSKFFQMAPGSNNEEEDKKYLYLMMSLYSKCTLITVCFSYFLIHALESCKDSNIQFTYGAERIIGWGLCDGDLDLKSNKISKLQVKRSSDKQLLFEVNRGTEHSWICFVTESGKVYDVDLSAFQFGSPSNTTLTFPCILPVDIGNSDVCFNGLCKRDNVISSTLSELKVGADQLLTINVARIHSMAKMDSRGLHPDDQLVQKHHLHQMFHQINQKMLSSVGIQIIMKCRDANFFWNTLKSL